MENINTRTKTLLLGAISLLLGISAVVLFFDQEIGLNYTLFMILVTSSGIFLAHTYHRHLNHEQYALIGTATFFSAMVFVRASELLTFFNILGSFLLMLVTISTLTGKRIRTFLPFDFLKVCFLPFRFIGPFFEILPSFFAWNKEARSTPHTKEIIRGILIAIPLLIVFGALFSSADHGFETLLSKIFTLSIDEELKGKIFFGMFISAFFIGAFGYLFNKVHAKEAPSPSVLSRRIGMTETMIVFGSVNALFLVFILLQISYLFGGTLHLVTEGLTYAGYAREGFSQLVFVAILSFLIITFAEQKIVQDEGRHIQSFQILSGVLILQVLIILVSAFSRLSLYEHAYGFTTIRLYSYAFMVWLAVALSLLAHHIWKNGKREDFIFRTFCSVVILLFTMNILNPDALIAKKNLERYRETGSLDVYYLASLSPDALPYTIQLLDDPKPEIRGNFARTLYWKIHPCGGSSCAEEAHTSSWQSLRLHTKNTEELLYAHKEHIKDDEYQRQVAEIFMDNRL